MVEISSAAPVARVPIITTVLMKSTNIRVMGRCSIIAHSTSVTIVNSMHNPDSLAFFHRDLTKNPNLYRKTSDAGNMLYRCRFCERAYCEDCLDFDIGKLIGDEILEFQLLDYY